MVSTEVVDVDMDSDDMDNPNFLNIYRDSLDDYFWNHW